MSRRQASLRSLAALLALFAAGCAAPIELPKDFVRVHDGRGFAAVTADEARVSVRELYDASAAPLDFWAEALRRDFVEQRGYEIVGEGETRDRDGVAGRWFECVTNLNGERIGYLVAVWADGSFWFSGTNLFVVELAARQEVFAARVEAVRQALSTVRR